MRISARGITRSPEEKRFSTWRRIRSEVGRGAEAAIREAAEMRRAQVNQNFVSRGLYGSTRRNVELGQVDRQLGTDLAEQRATIAMQTLGAVSAFNTERQDEQERYNRWRDRRNFRYQQMMNNRTFQRQREQQRLYGLGQFTQAAGEYAEEEAALAGLKMPQPVIPNMFNPMIPQDESELKSRKKRARARTQQKVAQKADIGQAWSNILSRREARCQAIHLIRRIRLGENRCRENEEGAPSSPKNIAMIRLSEWHKKPVGCVLCASSVSGR